MPATWYCRPSPAALVPSQSVSPGTRSARRTRRPCRGRSSEAGCTVPPEAAGRPRLRYWTRECALSLQSSRAGRWGAAIIESGGCFRPAAARALRRSRVGRRAAVRAAGRCQDRTWRAAASPEQSEAGEPRLGGSQGVSARAQREALSEQGGRASGT
eukprot:scaffold18436_cov33-Phaeocystis_antarctica.AAC.1